MEHEISVKRELLNDDIIEDSDDNDQPKLQISSVDHPDSSKDVIESLLLLGKQAVVSCQQQQSDQLMMRQRSFSSSISSNFTSISNSRRHSSSGGSDTGSKGVCASYYQRMRERNNEASKRCRLKRRMKAVSMENQASMLLNSNKLLKMRLQRLQQVGVALREGVNKIQSGDCACDLTVKKVQQANKEYMDVENCDLTSFEVIGQSKAIREQPTEGSSSGGRPRNPASCQPPSFASSCSSEDDLSNFDQPSMQMVRPTYKTALDVINETIVRTLETPLDLVIKTSSPNKQTEIPKKEYIKHEPMEVSSAVADSTVVVQSLCIANTNGASICKGDMLNLNKLTCYLDLITRKVSHNDDNGSTAMERAIIKSRLKIPFWSVDESAMFICAAHRASLVQGSDLNSCALCNKKRTSKKVAKGPSQVSMYTITYSMSLEFYTRNGHYLPIGLAVCALCREKHLKSVDLSNSRLIPSEGAELSTALPDSNSTEAPRVFMSPPPVATSLLKRDSISILKPSSGAISPKLRHLSASNVTSTNNGDTVIIVNSPQSFNKDPIKTVVPVSSSSQHNNGNIFAKISNLNEALQAINPKYQPIGFSITSMDSCSPGVLQDAISATEAAIFTVLSVIAPGQESNLWETVKPTLDKKMSRK